MSKIDDLIAKLCPNGVEYKTLGNCITKNIGGGTPSRSNPDYWDGDILWASVGDLSVPGKFIHTTRAKITSEGLKNSPSNIISRGDVIVAVKISPGKMKIAAEDIAINQDLRGLSLYEFIDNSFLIYYFQTISIIGNGTIVKGITTEALERIRIPVPPLEIQREIVKVLDTFTKLEAELEAELAAELEARRRQYHYYRDQLLNFEKLFPEQRKLGERERERERERETVKWMTLGELGEFIRGNGLQKKDISEHETELGAIHYGQIYTLYGTYTYKTESFVKFPNAKNLRKAKTNDLIIATTSENDTDVCKAVAWLGKENIAVSSDACIYRHSLDPQYVAYFFQSEQFQIQKRSNITGTKVRRVSPSCMASFLIPVPSLKRQQEIIAILDKFDALVNDLSSGLPAEIVARRKQYKYYRDRLLTFKEA